MADGVVALVLNRLSTFFHQDYTHLREIQRELKYIKDELESITAFLREAEARANVDSDPELEQWVEQVLTVANDTEDVLDELQTSFALHRLHRFFGWIRKFFTTMKTLKARHRIFTKIRDIKYRVEGISSRCLRYNKEYINFEIGRGSGAVEDVRYDVARHDLLLEEADLVGIQKPKIELISQITDDESHLKVISVVGMGGLGKTTLVRKVYEDGIIKRSFSSHAWVTVSQRFQIGGLLKSMVQQLYHEIHEAVPREVVSMDADGLTALVKGFLKDRKFILVLDDIWDINSWDAIKYGLPDGNCGSRVVLTTRMADVASVSGGEFRGRVYRMNYLSIDESWTLFCKRTFEDNRCPPHLVDISRTILSRCAGLPLAIVAICGLLALKNRNGIEEWEMVHSRLVNELGTGKIDQLINLLLFCYFDLPPYLKLCFLYISIYPEDYEIPAWKLIRLWIAEGFVQQRRGMTIVEVAESYLQELVNRGLVQVAKTHADGKPKYCSIHGLLCDLIVSKSKEQNITTVAGRYTQWSRNIRRLAIHDFNDEVQMQFRPKRLRSLVVFGHRTSLSSSLSELLCGGPKLLKVLDLEGAGMEKIPTGVFQLFHLKYLSLRGNPVEIIPGSIRKLQNLEFLNLIDTNITKLPIGILKLGRLRELHAFVRGDYSENFAVRGFKAPHEIGVLVSMECLRYIDVDVKKVVEEIGKLTQLRELGIRKLRRQDGKELCSSLNQLTNLRKLCVISNNEDEILDLQHVMSPTLRFLGKLVLKGPLEKLPQWVPSLRGLTRLALQGSRLMEDPLESLQSLPWLGQLILNDAYEGEALCFRGGGFQNLKRLKLLQLKRLRSILAEEGAMPQLNVLVMTSCKSVEELPQGIQNLSKLQALEFSDMSHELMTKLRNVHPRSDDYSRIAHVPEVVIRNWINGKWEQHYL